MNVLLRAFNFGQLPTSIETSKPPGVHVRVQYSTRMGMDGSRWGKIMNLVIPDVFHRRYDMVVQSSPSIATHSADAIRLQLGEYCTPSNPRVPLTSKRGPPFYCPWRVNVVVQRLLHLVVPLAFPLGFTTSWRASCIMSDVGIVGMRIDW